MNSKISDPLLKRFEFQKEGASRFDTIKDIQQWRDIQPKLKQKLFGFRFSRVRIIWVTRQVQ